MLGSIWGYTKWGISARPQSHRCNNHEHSTLCMCGISQGNWESLFLIYRRPFTVSQRKRLCSRPRMSGTSASGSGSNKSQPQLTPESKESKLKRLFHFGSKKPPNAFAATPRESRSSVAKGAQAGGAESRTAKIVTRSADAVVKAPISELWNEAWDELQIKEPTLFKEYEEHVDKAVSHSPKSHSVMAAMTATHSSATAFSGLGKLQRAEVMKALLEERIEELKSEQWKIKFGENEFAVKDMVGPVVGVIDWAKEFIGTAADASPYSSIAWAGVSLLLPVSFPGSLLEAGNCFISVQ
jgi:hypothetical protein